MKLNKTFTVQENQSALAVGSGSLDVLATPSAIAMAENTCMLLCESLVGEGETTVGTFIDIDHLKASKIDSEIEVQATIIKQDNRKINFSFEMYEKGKLIAKGNHTRVIVQIERFMSHIE